MILSHHVACSFISNPERTNALDRRLTTSLRILRSGTSLTGQHRWLAFVASLGSLSGRDVLPPPARTKSFLSMLTADAEGHAVVHQDAHRTPPSTRVSERQADVVQRTRMIAALSRTVSARHRAGVAAPGSVPLAGSGTATPISAPTQGSRLGGVAARVSLPIKKVATSLPTRAERRPTMAISAVAGPRTVVASAATSLVGAGAFAPMGTPAGRGAVVGSSGVLGLVVSPGRPPATSSARMTAGAAALGVAVAQPPGVMADSVAPSVAAPASLPDGLSTPAVASVPPALAAATSIRAVQAGAVAGLGRIAPLPIRDALVPLGRRPGTPAVTADMPAVRGQLHGQVVPLPPSRHPPVGRAEAAVSSARGDHHDAGLSSERGDGANTPPLIVNLTGDVVIDGRRLGRITATSQAREASLPAYGPSRVNLRAVPLYSGAQVPG